MSLQIWLPLVGNLKNEGLNPVSVTNNGATVNNNGKIGKCYSFNTSSSYMIIPKEAMTSFTTEASVCFWLKINAWNTNYATFFQAGLGGTAWTHYIFGFLRNNANSTCCFTISNGSSASNASYLTPALELNTWYHIGLIYKTGHCLIYINGQLYQDYTTSIVPNFAGITKITLGKCNNTSYYQTNCDINDFRIYNHALSLKEIKKISQGLILHYPLDNNGLGNPNLIQKNVFSLAPWKTAIYQKTIYYGRNTILLQFNTLYSNTSNGSQTIFPNITFKENTQYTLSWFWRDDYRTDGLTSSFYIRIFHTDGTKVEAISSTGDSASTQWAYRTLTSAVGKTVASIRVTYGRGGIIAISDIKLELGNKATKWTPSPKDYNSNIILDTSGYENHGLIIGSIEYKIDSPKNIISVYCDGSTSHIRADSLPAETQCISCWVKGNKTQNFVAFTDYNSGIQFGILNSQGVVRRTSAKLYNLTNWKNNLFNHVVVNKKSNRDLLWINGHLQGDGSDNNYYTHNADLWLFNRNYNNNYYFKGQLSDFRAYATNLSENDILELYQISALVNRPGDLFSYEFILLDNKKQILRKNVFYFNNYTEIPSIGLNIMPNSVNMALGSANPATGTWRLAGTSNMTRSRVLIPDSPRGECYGFQCEGIQNATTNDTSCYGIDSFPFEANTDYVISFWARKTSGTLAYAGFSIYNCTYGKGSDIRFQQQYYITPLPLDGSWIRCWKQFKTNSSTNRNIYIGITTGTSSTTAQICCIKIEKGILPSVWQPKETDENYELYRIKDNTITVDQNNCIFTNSFYET